MGARICDAADAHTRVSANRKGGEGPAETPLGEPRRGNVALYAHRRDGRRGPALPHTSRVRLQADRNCCGGVRQRKAAARSKHYNAADSQECVPLAGALVGEKGVGGVFHMSDRNSVGQAPYHGGVSQQHRDGRWDIRRGSGGAAALLTTRNRLIQSKLRPHCGNAAEPSETEFEGALCLRSEEAELDNGTDAPYRYFS